MMWVGIILVAFGGILVLMGRKQSGTRSRLATAKVVPVSQAQAGQIQEFQGVAVTGQALMTPYSKRACVYYRYEVERQTHVRDAQGRVSQRWEKVSNDEQSAPFWLRDASGQISVYPDGAQIEPQPLGEQLVSPGDLVNNRLLQTALNALTGFSTRVREWALLVDANVYVAGSVAAGQQGPIIQRGAGGDFIISYRSEEQYERQLGRSAVGMKVAAAVLAVIGVTLVIVSLT